MLDNSVERIIRGLVFSSSQGVTVDEVLHVLQEQGIQLNASELEKWFQTESAKLRMENASWELHQMGSKWTYLTAPDLAIFIRELDKERSHRQLSQAAMETLAVIAYRQPVTKIDVEQVRGVNCDYSVQKLLERGLISILGKKDAPGKPLIYGTSQLFLDHFGLSGPEDLPPLKELQEQEENPDALA